MAHSRTICIAGHRSFTEEQGGVEAQTRYLGEALAEGGWKVNYLSPSMAGREGRKILDHNTIIWWYPHFSFIHQVPVKQIYEILDRIRPDVFYQRGRGQLVNSRIIIRYARKNVIPIVFALSSDTDLDGLYGVRSNWIATDRPLWKKILLTPYTLWIDRAIKDTIRHAEHVVVQHERQRTTLEKKLGRKPHLLRSMHREVRGEIVKDEEKIVLWVANYRPLKRGGIFIRLAERCGDLDCRFVMLYGRTRREYIEPIIQMAQDTNNLEILGELPSGDVEKLMERASVYVNTSEEREGFPNTFIQSWLRETPVVSMNVDPGGILSGEGMGYFSGSFEGLVKDVRHLIEDDHDRRAMGKRARIFAQENHGFENNRQKHVEYFNWIIGNEDL
jgi:glycosyltransferase involved in cell wall biosynthesis